MPCYGNPLFRGCLFFPVELAACQAAWRSESQSALKVFMVLWEAAEYNVEDIQSMKNWITKNAQGPRADFLLEILETCLLQKKPHETLPQGSSTVATPRL